MSTEKTLERLVQREKRKQGPRVRQHHHEAGEQARAVTDPNAAEAAPVDLRLLSRQDDEAAVQGPGDLRPQHAHEAPDLYRGPVVAARLQHGVEPRRTETGILLQGLADKRQVGIELRAAARPRGTVRVSNAFAARTVSWWTLRLVAIVPTFQCSPK